jgi:hypothetical protein
LVCHFDQGTDAVAESEVLRGIFIFEYNADAEGK